MSVQSSDASAAPVAGVTRGGTRLRRSGLLFLPAMGGVLVLTLALIFGLIPLNLAVSGQDFKITSNGQRLTTPQGMTLYPARITMKDGKPVGVVVAGIPTATLAKGLCISLVLTFPVIGTWTIGIRTHHQTTAHDLVLDSSGLNADTTSLVPTTTDGRPPRADGKNVVTPVALGPSVNGGAGRFGVNSGGENSISNLRASAQGAIIAGTVNLKIPSISIHHGRGVKNGECY